METRPVVLVCTVGQRPVEAVSRAAAVAARKQVPLHVVLVSQDDDQPSDPCMATPVGSVPNRDERAWFDTWIPPALPHRYHRADGQLIHEAIHYALVHRAQLVVMPSHGECSACAAAIAAAARIPVLVARPPTHGDTIIAATDLTDVRYPVLRQAAEMLDHAGVRLVGMHARPEGTTAADAMRLRAELAVALEPLTRRPESMIYNEHDPADAVVSVACERDADLIVVGVPARGWLDSLLRQSVASRVVATARSSVLVTPIRDESSN